MLRTFVKLVHSKPISLDLSVVAVIVWVFFNLGTKPAVLRAHVWLYVQESVLKGSGLCKVPGMNPG